MDLSSKIVLVSGPTASGKSKFAIKLAKKINGEIVNADSMQVYKELKILSARPFKKAYKKIPHHLYGFQNVKKKFSTGHWLKLANKKILDIKKRKKVPILVGGTGLYFKALTEGLVKIPNISIKFRDKINIILPLNNPNCNLIKNWVSRNSNLKIKIYENPKKIQKGSTLLIIFGKFKSV